MFWTAFVWGLGVSVGASIGMFSFIVLYAIWNWFMNSKVIKQAADIGQLTLNALNERNNLTKDQVKTLERIAACYEDLHLMMKTQR